MAETKRHLIDHVFAGGRFDDHGVDVAALPDLVAFRDLVVETAKELWRLRHPRRQRVPKGFEQSILLKFYEVKPGSAALPLFREYVKPLEPLFQQMIDQLPDDEFDDAVNEIASAVNVLGSGGELPDSFPRSVIPQLSAWGSSLAPTEAIELRRGEQKIATLGKSVRDRIYDIANAIKPSNERPFDVTGMVTMARVVNPRMAITLDDGRAFEMPFDEQDEEMITRALHERTSVRVRVMGSAEYTADGVLDKLIHVESIEIVPAIVGDATNANRPPLWLMIEELMSDVPDEEMAKVPPARSTSIDRKLYGKKSKATSATKK